MSTIDNLQHITSKINDADKSIRGLRAERDALVAKARTEGLRFNDIANATGMSVSWINASLVRSNGYRPRAGRPRRRAQQE